jgi:hypothetical protein
MRSSEPLRASCGILTVLKAGQLSVRFIVFLVAALGVVVSRASDSNVFEGTFVVAYEVQRFTPDSGNGAWWLEGKIPCVREFFQSRDPNEEFDAFYFHLKIRGTLSDEGHFGHLNAYPRKLTVEAVLDCRQIPKPAFEP